MDRCERAYAFGVPAGETFGDGGDLGGEPHGQNYEWLFPIGSNDQQIAVGEPSINLAKGAGPTFDLHAAIDAEQRDR